MMWLIHCFHLSRLKTGARCSCAVLRGIRRFWHNRLKITLITTVYTYGEATIRDAIKSVLAQQDVDFEHIVIDGGSTDQTVNIVKSLDHRRMTWISGNQMPGVYDRQRNKGIVRATGDLNLLSGAPTPI